jgi:tetratricopeptide (TPR) repeat protein
MDDATVRLWAGRAAAAVATCAALEGDKHAGERDSRYLLHAQAVLQHIQQWKEWEESATLTPIWYYVGLVAEQYGQTSAARDASLQGLQIVSRRPHPLEAALLAHAGYMVSDLGDDQQALTYLEQGAQRARQINDKNTLGFALLMQGQIQDNLGRYQLAGTMYQEGLTVSRETQDWAMVSAFLQNLGVQAGRRGDYEQAIALYEEGLAYARQSQQLLPQSSLLMNLGMLAVLQQQHDQALAYILELIARALFSLAHVAARQHRYEEGSFSGPGKFRAFYPAWGCPL